jgi:hypothetical protein
MTARSSKLGVAASAPAFNGGNQTVMAASAAKTTLNARAEVSARVRANSGGCGWGRGAGGSKGKGKGMADSDSCGEL